MDTLNLRKQFLTAFQQAFAARFVAEPDVVRRYTGADWTRVMLGGTGEKEGVLRVSAKAYGLAIDEDCSAHQQWYTLDLSLVTPPCRDKTEYWQTRTVLALEHENGDDVETEMWKLAHWSAPLSVCVFYDFNEGKLDGKAYRGDRSVGEVARQDWLAAKLALLSDIVKRVDSEEPERHLLIIGNRMLDGALRWRSSSWDGDGFGAPAPI